MDWSNIRSAMQSEICNRGSGPLGEKAIGVLVYRGICHRALGLSGILQSGFWFIGDFVIGVLVRRGFCYRAFDLSGFCYRANGHRAFGYRPYVVYPGNPGNFDRYLAFRATANRMGTFNIGYSVVGIASRLFGRSQVIQVIGSIFSISEFELRQIR